MATRHAWAPAQNLPSLEAMEKGLGAHGEFADRAMRAGFLRKVFGLLSVQLAITTLIGALCVAGPGVATYLFSHPAVPMLAVIGSLGILLAFTLSERARSSHPTNLVLLLAFTVCEGLLVGLASARYPADLVITAFALTVAVTGGLALYALRTKTDWTSRGGFLSAMLLSFITCTLMALVFHVPISRLAVSLVGACLFSMYLIFDIQLLMGGHHAYKLSPDEFVLGAITIYLDIVNIFLHILRALAEMRRD